MTERGLPLADGAPACPFVAFEDERDERATSPDHRHRCFAESTPAPRALAHQEAYCLSSAFPVCPTFQDWARREAARARAESERSSDDAGAAGDAPLRNPPRNWAEPPPWASRGGRAAGAGGLWDDPEPDDHGHDHGGEAGDHGDHGDHAHGLSGSYADRMARGGGRNQLEGGDDAALDEEAPPFAGGHQPEAASLGAAPADHGVDDDTYRGHDEMADRPTARPVEPRRPIAPAAPERPRDRRRDPGAPDWEHGRPREAYPTLRSRRLPELTVPPLLVGVIALALAAAVLFTLPGLLGFGNPGTAVSPTPPTASQTFVPSLPPTPVPEPTAQIYVVQSGDTMSRIANRFGIPLEDLIAANEATIPDPDTLQIGDQVLIPVISSVPSELPAAS